MRSRPVDNSGLPDIGWARINAAGTILAQGGSVALRCVKGGAGTYTVYADPPFTTISSVQVQSTGGVAVDVVETASRPEGFQYSVGASDLEHFVTLTGRRRL